MFICQVAILDTDSNTKPGLNTLVGHQCHDNAVCDIAWTPGQQRLISSSSKFSGDYAECTYSFDLLYSSRRLPELPLGRRTHRFEPHSDLQGTLAVCEGSYVPPGRRKRLCDGWSGRSNFNLGCPCFAEQYQSGRELDLPRPRPREQGTHTFCLVLFEQTDLGPLDA